MEAGKWRQRSPLAYLLFIGGGSRVPRLGTPPTAALGCTALIASVSPYSPGAVSREPRHDALALRVPREGAYES